MLCLPRVDHDKLIYSGVIRSCSLFNPAITNTPQGWACACLCFRSTGLYLNILILPPTPSGKMKIQAAAGGAAAVLQSVQTLAWRDEASRAVVSRRVHRCQSLNKN